MFADTRISKLSVGNIVNRTVAGTLTLAQMQTLYTTPVQVLPPLNTGFMYVVDNMVLEAEYGTAAFTGGGNIYLQYGTTPAGTTPASANVAAAFLTGLSANSVISATGSINSTTGLAVSVVNGAAITLTNAAAVFAVGTGGSAAYTVYYKVVPVV